MRTPGAAPAAGEDPWSGPGEKEKGNVNFGERRSNAGVFQLGDRGEKDDTTQV